MTRYRSVVQTFWCDAPECFNSYEAEGGSETVWSDAHSVGWRRQYGKHFCPEHAYKEEQK